jgi:hypothetical protein
LTFEQILTVADTAENRVQPTTNIVTNLMWPIVLLGGLGVFIDFVLGAAGQRRVKEWMTEWWVIFEDTDWKSFSTVEAQFFKGLSDRLFGQHLAYQAFGLRRLRLRVGVDWAAELPNSSAPTRCQTTISISCRLATSNT